MSTENSEKKEEQFARTKGKKEYGKGWNEMNIGRWMKLKTFVHSFTLSLS